MNSILGCVLEDDLIFLKSILNRRIMSGGTWQCCKNTSCFEIESPSLNVADLNKVVTKLVAYCPSEGKGSSSALKSKYYSQEN